MLATKLHAPEPGADAVPRAHLVERLRSDASRTLTLVSAPAGSGKSTLLASWRRAAADTPFAWVSLDAGDNDAARFWSYVVEALRAVAPGVGADALAHLRTTAAAAAELAVASLANDLAALDGRVVLVLDDYHLIESEQVHEGVASLLEHPPRALHVVITTRSDPPLPVARLRVRGELAEVRAPDLQFSRDEAAAFLNGQLGLGLADRDVTRLWERTEGWPAGLYLAALSLASREERSAFIEAFAGDDRHVVDYLAAEVLDAQPQRTRDFLVRTSVLERLSGPLCDALLGRTGSARVLHALERSNLFLVPLDTRRRWYRYHQLFADLLAHELRLTQPELVPELHRRAAGWLRGQGHVSDAIRHSAAAGDVPAASDLVALHWNDFVNSGRIDTVAAWLRLLPEGSVAADARLCIAQAGVHLASGRRDGVEPWLDAAEAASGGERPRFGAASIEAEAAIYRAVNRFMSGDVGRAEDAAVEAVELEREDDSPWRAMALAALGRTRFWTRGRAGAEDALEEAAGLSDASSNNLSVIGALGYLAALHAERGELRDAEARAREALELADERGLAEHWVGVMALVARARVLELEGAAGDAVEAARRAVELARRGAVHVEEAYALLVLADLLRRTRPEEARRHLRDARSLVAGCRDPGRLADLVEGGERRLGLRRRAERHRVEGTEELSARELAVLQLLPGERSLREIATALYVSHNTVKTHTRAIYRKLGASTRDEAVSRARRLELL